VVVWNIDNDALLRDDKQVGLVEKE